MWPFTRKPIVEPEMADWMFDHAEWLLSCHSRSNSFAKAQLLPISDKVFPQNGLEGHDLAAHLMDRVLGYMDMSALRVNLLADDSNALFRDTGNGFRLQPKANAAGSYRVGYGIEITYDTDLLKRPADLVAVLAHEASHAVLDLGASLPPPSDSDFDELLTDFTSVFFGFGLFQIAFRQPMNPQTLEIADEWRKLYAYYMNRAEGCFATALFCAVHGVEPKLAVRGCDMDARGDLKRAFADLEPHRTRIADIRQALMRAKAT